MLSKDTARTLIGIIGNVTALVLFLSPLPTIVKIWKKKSVEQFSAAPYLATFLNCGMWVLYAIPSVHPNSFLLMTINSAGIAIYIVFLLVFLFFSDTKTRFRVALIVLAEVAFMAALAIMVLTLAHTWKLRSTIVGSIVVFVFDKDEQQENVSTEFEPSLPITPISQHEEFQFDTPVHALDDNLVPPLVFLEQAENDTSGNDDPSLAFSEQAEPSIPPSPPVCTASPNGSQTDSIINNGQSVAAPPRRSTRTRQVPNKLHDYYCDTVIQNRTSPHSLLKVISYDGLSSTHRLLAMAVTSIDDPKSYNQAVPNGMGALSGLVQLVLYVKYYKFNKIVEEKQVDMEVGMTQNDLFTHTKKPSSEG
nr:bidirectional sugar transporter SWEET4-like [Ipomoea batatas]